MTSTPRKSADGAAAPRSHGPRRPWPASNPSHPRPHGSADESTHDATGGESALRASVRVYCQGLGDCILVRVRRNKGEDFKLLIDCGVVLGTENAASVMQRVADDIVKEVNESIDVLAITHEHWDHVSGFIQASESFEKLAVGAVWVAWTEDPDDALAKQLRDELGRASQKLAACASALEAAGDTATRDMLADIALTPFGAAASRMSTKAAFDKAKSKGKVAICRPDRQPFDIPDANARIYVLGPPHDPKLIRKINPSTSSPETYGLAMTGEGALPLGVISALDSRDDGRPAPTRNDPAAPFHPRMTIPLGPKGRPWLLDKNSVRDDAWRRVDQFLRDYYYGNDASESDDWRRIDGEWLGSAAELALALQSYTNNTSLVLALELGDPGKGDVLLFAADAQVGNWESWQSWRWETDDGRKVTGPDLLKRTIFYKVGHHGSHNGTLKDHGVEQMDALKVAVVPVDAREAKKKRWGRMPLPDLIAALEKKAPGNIFRTDQKPGNPAGHVVIGENYIEINF